MGGDREGELASCKAARELFMGASALEVVAAAVVVFPLTSPSIELFRGMPLPLSLRSGVGRLGLIASRQADFVAAVLCARVCVLCRRVVAVKLGR